MNDATTYLTNLLSTIVQDEHDDLLQNIIDKVIRQSLATPVLNKEILEKTFEEISQFESPNPDKIFHVIDAFSVPRFTYNLEKRKFVIDNSIINLNGTAEKREILFRERYRLLSQRTTRHKLFLPPVPGASAEENDEKFHLQPVEYLLATTARLGNLVVLGMLSQLKEVNGNKYFNDHFNAMQHFRENFFWKIPTFHPGLITENCFVLAEGSYDDGIFHVQALGFPPAESAETTRTYFGNENFFGGPHTTSVKLSPQLLAFEQDHRESMFVLLSDVWLNEIKVQKKLNTMLSGFAESPPTCFIFIGNFLSGSLQAQSYQLMTSSLKALGNIIAQYPSILRQSKFVFIPGPRDPGIGSILPRPPIPSCLTEQFCKKVPSAVFTTNPCRIQFCTKEIVVFREDLVTKICRSVVHFPTTGEIPHHFVKTLISQSHLCPLPLNNAPIYWSYDHSLRLYPLPDVIVCADKYSSYCVSNMGCTFFNPGSFATNNGNFKVYMPVTGEVEDSQIIDDETLEKSEFKLLYIIRSQDISYPHTLLHIN
uniref:DNA polymerase epsilon subunit n=1 Tax=Strigamia maritima TaxID=126957 RepID=T1IYN3_STRMM